MAIGDAVDGALAGGVSALSVALILGDAALDHGTGLEAGEPLVGALDDVDVTALVLGGAHGLALAESLLGGSLGFSLGLGGGGVFRVDTSGDVLGVCVVVGALGEVFVERLVQVFDVLLLVLLPVLALEGRVGGIGVGIGVGVGIGILWSFRG